MVDQKPVRGKSTPIPPVGPIELSEATIDEFVAWAARSNQAERLRVREAIQASRGNRAVIEPLFDRFERATPNDLGRGLILLGIIGELRDEGALERLVELVWRTAPQEDEVGHGALGARDLLEMVQSKAVEGIAYLGSDRSDEETLRVAREHPSVAVRSAAVDAYLYHQGDGDDARERLKAIIPNDDLPFVDRVRRMDTGDRDTFNEGMRRFYELHPQERAPEPGEPTESAKEDRPSTATDIPIEPPDNSDR